jgi:molybdate transport system regulatory protein
MTNRNRRFKPDLDLRVTIDGQVLIGPIQAMLLEAIRRTGSISAAHRELGITYAHVWKLVTAMNRVFSPPLVNSIRGGAKGGGALLTQQGHKVLSSYRRMEELLRDLARTELLVIGRAVSQVGERLDIP